MHHPKTRPVFEPFLFIIETARQVELFTPKHIFWPSFNKNDHNLCYGVNKFSYSAISITNKKGFKNWLRFRVVHLLVYSYILFNSFIALHIKYCFWALSLTVWRNKRKFISLWNLYIPSLIQSNVRNHKHIFSK